MATPHRQHPEGRHHHLQQARVPQGTVEGVGFHEAPRGVLSHWVVIEDGTIKNYQAVVPTTWNASPRDTTGTLGPYESSLLQNPVADPEHPLEVLRTIHSCDPCMACAVHTFDALTDGIVKQFPGRYRS